MGRISGLRRFLRLPARQRSVLEDVDEELRFHIERRTEQLVTEGYTEDEARAEARRKFGDVDRIQREVGRVAVRAEGDRRRAEALDSVRQDLGFAARQLAKKPVFASIVILTIALGIGANTAIFSVVDGVLLRPLPYPEPQELVNVWSDWSARGGPVREWLGFPDFHDLRQEVPALEELALYDGWGPTLTGRGEAEQLNGSLLSTGMFSRVLGVAPVLGRDFLPEEEEVGGDEAVLISDGFWHRALGADPDVVGTMLVLSDVPHRIVGVMPAGFRPPFIPNTDIWAPLQQDMTNFDCGRGCAGLRAVGRLADGMSLDVLREQSRNLGRRLAVEYPETHTGRSFSAFSLKDDLVSSTSTGLWVLLGAVGFVLLIASVNVANLLLARATTRRSELAVRSALGAGRSRIARQLLTENALLAAVGGGLGIVVAYLGTNMLVSLAPRGTPRLAEVAVDGRVLGFAAAVTLFSGLVFGLVPALRSARAGLHDALREGGRSGGDGPRGGRVRNALVVSQVALALVLLVGAGLLVRSFQALQDVDLGFEPEGVLAMSVLLPGSRYPDREATRSFFVDLEKRVRALPGVVSVASTNTLPLSGRDGDVDFNIEGQPIPAPGEHNQVWFRRVTPGYFETVGLRLVAGRDFTSSEDSEAPRVVIINQTLVDRFFPEQNPIGQRINLGATVDPVWRTVVGVARDIKNFSIRSGSRNAMYAPYLQVPTRALSLVIKVDGDPDAIIPSVRSTLASADPGLAAGAITPIGDFVASSLATDRFVTTLLSLFASAALLLAVLGLYGVVSYGVSSRSREMGVRIALGAERKDIGSLIVGSSLGVVAVGTALGMAGAYGLTRLMEGLLFGVGATDPMTFATAGVLLVGVATVASAIPARRAASVDPISVLKAE
jgi:putative ABC transport system permease protein